MSNGTPISGDVAPSLLCSEICAQVVDRKLNDLIKLGEDEWPSLHSCYASTTTTTVIASPRTPNSPYASLSSTATSPLPFEIKNTKSQRQSACNNIANRLPVRSQATIHRQNHTSIAYNLSPRAASRATYNRKSTWANLNRTTWHRT